MGIDLFDSQKVERIFMSLAKKLGLNVVETRSHYFKPYGLSLVLILQESHLAVHTWPELKFVHLDLVSCGKEIKEKELSSLLKEQVKSSTIEVKKIEEK